MNEMPGNPPTLSEELPKNTERPAVEVTPETTGHAEQPKGIFGKLFSKVKSIFQRGESSSRKAQEIPGTTGDIAGAKVNERNARHEGKVVNSQLKLIDNGYKNLETFRNAVSTKQYSELDASYLPHIDREIRNAKTALFTTEIPRVGRDGQTDFYKRMEAHRDAMLALKEKIEKGEPLTESAPESEAPTIELIRPKTAADVARELEEFERKERLEAMRIQQERWDKTA